MYKTYALFAMYAKKNTTCAEGIVLVCSIRVREKHVRNVLPRAIILKAWGGAGCASETNEYRRSATIARFLAGSRRRPLVTFGVGRNFDNFHRVLVYWLWPAVDMVVSMLQAAICTTMFSPIYSCRSPRRCLRRTDDAQNPTTNT